jgi:hypothetical protein
MYGIGVRVRVLVYFSYLIRGIRSLAYKGLDTRKASSPLYCLITQKDGAKANVR